MLARSLTLYQGLAAIALNLALPAMALAGDFASLTETGFSQDGRIFTFSQSGVQDGSGFPYAEHHFIDLDRDGFIAGSPVRVRLDDESAALSEARRQAREKADPLFSRYGPFTPGFLAAANPPTETSADPHRIAFRPRAVEPYIDGPVELTLELLPLASKEHCTAFGHEISGFRLTRHKGEERQILHEDTRIPESRNCPFDYSFAEIRVFGERPGEWRAVAIIGVRSVGFEGPDYRHIAIPVPLD